MNGYELIITKDAEKISAPSLAPAISLVLVK